MNRARLRVATVPRRRRARAPRSCRIGRRPPTESAGERATIHLEVPAAGRTAGAAEAERAERHVAELATLTLRPDERLPVDHEDAADSHLDREVEHDAGARCRAAARLGEARERCIVSCGEREARERSGTSPRGRHPASSSVAAWRSRLPETVPETDTPIAEARCRTSAPWSSATLRRCRPGRHPASRPPAHGIARSARPARRLRPASPVRDLDGDTSGPSGCGTGGRRAARAGRPVRAPLRQQAAPPQPCGDLGRRAAAHPEERATSARETPGRSWTRRSTASAPAARWSAPCPEW